MTHDGKDDRVISWHDVTGFCAYCGAPCRGVTCAAHADLPKIEAREAAGDRSVEAVDRPNGLRDKQRP